MRQSKFFLLLHITIILWSFTAILGKLIEIDSAHLVFYRMSLAAISLGIYLAFTKTSFRLHKNDIFRLLFIGGIISLHWITFFASIKLSTVSVALVCLSSSSLFTTFLDSLIRKVGLNKLEVFISLIIIVGIVIIFNFETEYTLGIISGLVSAMLAALFTILNSKEIKKNGAPVISFYEMLAGGTIVFLVLLARNIFLGISFSYPSNMDWFYLILLATGCTAFAFVLGVYVMKVLSPFIVVLSTTLEPIYGIILSLLLFGIEERMSNGFYIGSTIVIVAVFAFPILRKRLALKRHPIDRIAGTP